MRIDQYGRQVYSAADLERLLKNGYLSVLESITVANEPEILQLAANETLNLSFETAWESIEQFDAAHQEWSIPEDYKAFNVEEYCLSLCSSQDQRQRVVDELNIFKKKKMLPVLQALKYLVDTFRKNQVVWGVGRGSSVSSYVLFLLGVHKIDSLHYDLDYREFLRSEGDQNERAI